MAVWNRTQISYNLLLAPLARFAAFPRQEPPALRGVFLFGDIMGAIKFTPSNEMETREWFAANLNKFEYNIIRSRTGFPDYILEDSNGIELNAEIEFLSGSFTLHKHDPNLCDLIICWQHDGEVILPVLELSTGKSYQPGERGIKGKPAIRPTENSMSIAKMYQMAKTQCAKEYSNYEQAFVEDLEADKEALMIMIEPRKRLERANRILIEALRRNGFKTLRELHPRDLMTMFGNYVLKQYQGLDFYNNTSNDGKE